MGFKFNIFTGTLDLVNPTASGTGVVGIAPSTDKAIPRWQGTGANTIQDSKAIIQDGGAIQAQGFITKRIIDDVIQIPSGHSLVFPSIELSDTGSIEIDDDGELIIV